jgi:quercetin dioxygenase-like cupin family protein
MSHQEHLITNEQTLPLNLKFDLAASTIPTANGSIHIGVLTMKQILFFCFLAVACVIMIAQDHSKPAPRTFPLDCTESDCSLLTGAPQTAGMRGGSVHLKPGASVGSHSTSGNEEALVILHGKAALHIEGHTDVSLAENMLAYIPSETRHNVTNTGTDELRYVWVVAPLNGMRR